MGPQDTDIILIFISSALITVTLASLVAIFVVTYQKRIAAQQLQMQQLENKRNQELLKATIEGQERERKRLAKDLHDGIGSLLSGLKLNLSFQVRNAHTTPEQINFLKEARDMIDEGMVTVRRVSHNLLPATLENFGLIEALRECMEPLQKTGEIDITLAVEGNRRFDHEAELGLLRVLQELLSNTLKHAQASQINIHMVFSTTALSITYQDNGIGIEATATEKGLGLKNITSRLQALGAEIALSPTAGRGFFAEIHLNLHS